MERIGSYRPVLIRSDLSRAVRDKDDAGRSLAAQCFGRPKRTQYAEVRALRATLGAGGVDGGGELEL